MYVQESKASSQVIQTAGPDRPGSENHGRGWRLWTLRQGFWAGPTVQRTGYLVASSYREDRGTGTNPLYRLLTDQERYRPAKRRKRKTKESSKAEQGPSQSKRRTWLPEDEEPSVAVVTATLARRTRALKRSESRTAWLVGGRRG